jgi:hypothetical protein
MAFRLNIIISIIFHVTLVLVVVALNSRDTLFRLPSDHMTVALLKEFTEIKSRSNQETKAEKRTIHVPVLKTTVFENPKRPAILFREPLILIPLFLSLAMRLMKKGRKQKLSVRQTR